MRRPSADGSRPIPYSSQRRSTSSFTASSISISGGHGRAPSSGHLAVASMPSLPPTNCRSGAWSRWSSGPVRDDDVALRVDVGPDVEEDLLVVVHVHVGVDDDDRLRQREHPEAPDRVHHLARVAGERLADRDDHAVVEGAGDGEVVVDDLRHGHAHGRQEDPLGRLPEPGVLLRAASRPRSTGRSRRAASSSPRRGRRGTAPPACSSRCGRRTAPRARARPSRCSPRARSPRSRAPRGRSSLHATISTGRPRRKPASISSSMCFGSGALAE